MKRSEMISNLASWMYENNDKYDDQLSAAEAFLKFVEDKGMLPPFKGSEAGNNFEWDEE